MHTKPALTAVILVAGLFTFMWVAPGEGSSPPAEGPAAGLQLQFGLWACLLGALSAVSLPMGALAGVLWRPTAAVTAALAAFGAGALLAALSVELVAPTAHALVDGTGGHAGGDPLTAMLMLLAGSVVGGILFVVLDQIVNAKGGYLRKTATTITHFTRLRNHRQRLTLARLSHIDLLRKLPAESVRALVDRVRPVVFNKGETIFREGDVGDRVYFIEEGVVALSGEGGEFKTLGAGEVLGEIALVTGARRTVGALAQEQTRVLVLQKADFDSLRTQAPALGAAAAELATTRLEELREHQETVARARADWAAQAAEALRHGAAIPTQTEVRQEARKHSGAPLAIWLGILLDGIPESFVIGAGFLGLLTARLSQGEPSFLEVIPYTLIAGLFLSNFPEALSSSVGMRYQGWSTPKILVLWLSLVVVTAAGSGLGYGIGSEVSPAVVSAIEGLAAGAMLTMIAQTMIPEAVHLGGANVVGLSTLAGFLAAVAFKILEA